MDIVNLTDKEIIEKSKNQLELKNLMAEMKNTLQWLNSRLYDAEQWINDLEHRIVENIQAERQKKI